MNAKILITATVLGTLLGAAGPAGATHKQWIIKGGAALCAFSVPTTSGEGRGHGFDLTNFSGLDRFAECPIPMAARWASHGSGGTWSASQQLWAALSTAKVVVDVQNSSSAADCTLTVKNQSGSNFFTRTEHSTGLGVQALQLVRLTNGFRDLGGTLSPTPSDNSVKKLPYVSFMFSCKLPARDPLTGNYSSLQFYQLDPCQNPSNTECGPGIGEDLENSCSNQTFIQTSGLECSALDAMDSDMLRTSWGLKNRSTTDWHDINCPIAPPVDDTKFHRRSVNEIKVFYMGGSSSDTCIDDGTCPKCFLVHREHTGGPGSGFARTTTSLGPLLSPIGNGVLSTSTRSVGWDADMAIGCTVPPGITIKGTTAKMTLTAVVNAN